MKAAPVVAVRNGMKAALVGALALGCTGCRGEGSQVERSSSSADTRVPAGAPASRDPDGQEGSRLDASEPRTLNALGPEAFPELPPRVRTELLRRACRVPQSWHSSPAPHNVIRGEFAAPGQVDWAVLCSRGDSSGIVVAWGGTATCPASIAWSANGNWFQDVGNGQIAFSRAIGVASQQRIAREAAAYGGPPPPSRDHAGIEDAFVEKASSIWYCHGGAWIPLQGAD